MQLVPSRPNSKPVPEPVRGLLAATLLIVITGWDKPWNPAPIKSVQKIGSA